MPSANFASTKPASPRATQRFTHRPRARADIDGKVDGIVSSKTMPYIENVAAMPGKFHGMPEHGFIAIADLDQEDGAFRTEDTGSHPSSSRQPRWRSRPSPRIRARLTPPSLIPQGR